MTERRCWLSVLVDVLERYDGAILGRPSELARDGRDVADDWLRCGWPATGHGLVQLLERRADELRSIGLVVHHTPGSPGQPEFLSVCDVAAPPRRHPRLAPESYVPVWRPSGPRKPGPRPLSGRSAP